MRREASAVLAMFFLTVALSSCGKVEQTPASESAPTAQVAPAGDPGPFVVIGHMEHRDRIITIKAGAQGTVYSAKTKDGKVIFDNLTADQLKIQSPEIHDFIAADVGSGDRYERSQKPAAPLDASH